MNKKSNLVLELSDFTEFITALVANSKKRYISIYMPEDDRTLMIKANKKVSRLFRSFTMSDIYEFMKETYPESITKTQRHPHIYKRFIMAYTAKYSGGYTYREIQNYFGKHHATWVHACKASMNFLDMNDPNFVTMYQEFMKKGSNYLDKKLENAKSDSKH